MVLITYLYPLKGILYFIGHGSLIRRVLLMLIVVFFVTLATMGLVFGFLLNLQATSLISANCPAWLAWTVAVIFCLIESAMTTTIIYLIITPMWQDALFDDVLRLKGLGHVLDEKKRKSTSELILCCRGIGSGLLILVFQIYTMVIFQSITLLITLPLHALPFIGTVLYCYLNGWIAAWSHQIHYHLEIKGWSVSQSRKYAWKDKMDYIRFGAVAVALELIPIANFLFFWTNVVGAALWTADVILDEEKKAKSNAVNDNSDSNDLINNQSSLTSFTTSPYQPIKQMDVEKGAN